MSAHIEKLDEIILLARRDHLGLVCGRLPYAQPENIMVLTESLKEAVEGITSIQKRHRGEAKPGFTWESLDEEYSRILASITKRMEGLK